MTEQQSILEMIQNGQITAIEGMELLEALNGYKEENSKSEPVKAVIFPTQSIPKYKFLKVKVVAENGKTNVNVNVPIKLLITLGEVTNKMTAFIPKETRLDMESKGIDLSAIDFKGIIESLLDGTLDDPTIVEVEVAEADGSMTKVKIYAE